MSVVNNNLLLTADAGVAPSAYQIQRSLRFNSADSATLSRTPSVAGNQKTWTWAAWVKRSGLASLQQLFEAKLGGATYTNLYFLPGDILQYEDYETSRLGLLTTTSVFRDLSAWCHIVLSSDTTQATSTDRIKLYINGSQITTFSATTYPSQNRDTYVNSTQQHRIGGGQASAQFFNGYLADVHFIDGQALTPSSFTETNATTGQLVPKAYSGTYGTNGFRLNFSDNSAATAATLGADSGGGISVATGALPIYNTTDNYGITKGTGTRTDSNASSLVLAIPMDGANNGTTFTDESATIKGSGTAKAITRNGDTKTLTAQSKFYGSSGFFDGTGDYLSIADTSDLDQVGDFTQEGWYYRTGSGQGSIDILCLKNVTNYLYVCCDRTNNKFVINQHNIANVLFGTTVTVANTWYHVAIARQSGTVRLFVNGVLEGSFSNSTNTTGSAVSYIGGFPSAHSTTGYLQDLRIYKGVAKYTSNFTPPLGPNNWTPNNLSVTAGAGNDSLTDTPTSYGTDTGTGGEVRGNYCTWNPLNGGGTLSNGNLDITVDAPRAGTIAVSTGKWYWEILVNGTGDCMIGISLASRTAFGSYLGQNSQEYGYYSTYGWKYTNNAATNPYGATFSTGSVIGVALDLDSGSITFYKNGVSQGVAFTGLTGSYYPAISDGAGAGFGPGTSANFGQRPFAYAAPSGFKALCDTNLPTPTIAKGSSVFDTKLYTGNGSTQTISGLDFSPDLVWIKGRSVAYNHRIFDTVRGTGGLLYTNTTDAEVAQPNANDNFVSFNADGFSIGSPIGLNQNSATYVSWCWDAGTSIATNTAGTISSQVRANPSAGFSVVTYTGTQAAATVGHGLGVAPSMIIVKSRTVAGAAWPVYHISLGGTNKVLVLSNTGAPQTVANYWGSVAPTSTVFGVSNGAFDNNNGNLVAYCFAPVTGYSSFGSYTGNGSADGSFVYTGFRPRWIITKPTSIAGSWLMHDTSRNPYNVSVLELQANATLAEYSTAGVGAGDRFDILSNGFKNRSANSGANQNGVTYIYAAFAENPFQYARAR